MTPAEEKELVGIDADFDVELKDGKAIILVHAKHVGSDVEVDVPATIKVNAGKFTDKALDAIEKAIPGDQVALFNSFKAMVRNIKF